MHIRTYEPRDEPAVIALWTEVFAYTQARNEPTAALRRKLSMGDGLLYVAEMDGVVAGTVMGGYDGHRGWIYSLAVLSAHRRRGIGTALVRRLEEELARCGCPKVNLQLLAENAATAAFYEKLGYAVEPRVSMGKELL